ncbi:UDP-N-acetylglucosamine 2-epimerase, partial [Rhodanobacter spathiphylli]
VCGNTVIDAIKLTVKKDYKFKSSSLQSLHDCKNRIVLVTAHRRENLGLPLENICAAVKRLAEDFPDVKIVYPVHLNP